jgi:streptogramin lyase
MKGREAYIFIAASILLIFSSFASAENIYVSCAGNGSIYKFDTSGNRSTFASGLNNPQGLAFDRSGNLYTATSSGIYKFNQSGNRSTFASGLNNPQGLTFDSSGNLYAASYADQAIYKFDSSGNKSTFASDLHGLPEGLTFDNGGNLYVGVHGLASLPNFYEGSIYKYNSSGQKSWFAYWNINIGVPMGLAFDGSGNLFMSDYARLRISKFDSSGNRSTFASDLSNPYGLAFGSGGNLYTALYGNGTIMKFDSSGNSSIFASGLSQPTFITTDIPEPATLLLFAAGGLILRRKR